jgi:hypothetical protein
MWDTQIRRRSHAMPETGHVFKVAEARFFKVEQVDQTLMGILPFILEKRGRLGRYRGAAQAKVQCDA